MDVTIPSGTGISFCVAWPAAMWLNLWSGLRSQRRLRGSTQIPHSRALKGRRMGHDQPSTLSAPLCGIGARHVQLTYLAIRRT